MKENNHFEELVVSYLLHELTVEEEAFVLQWINSSSEHRNYFEEVKKTLHLIEAQQGTALVNVEGEWKKFAEKISANTKEPEPAAVAVAAPLARRRNYYALAITAMAACLLIVFFIGRHSTVKNETTVVAHAPVVTAKPVADEIKLEVNSTNGDKKIVLPDGSIVTLHASSQVSYKKLFDGKERDINLIGNAGFSVAKDKARPFTVYSGDISTTALGTMFTVYAKPGAEKTRVRLFKGKVVVRSITKAKKSLKSDYYLLAGQELVYDNKQVFAIVRDFKSKTNTEASPGSENNLVEHLTVPSLGKESWFMFNNQSLPKVLEQLKTMYGVDIQYSKESLSKIYFIGSFKSADPVDTVLAQIAALNNLQLSKQDNTFFISK